MAGLVDDLLVSGMQLEDGCIVVPTAPGMGIDVDLAKIETYRVKE